VGVFAGKRPIFEAGAQKRYMIRLRPHFSRDRQLRFGF